MNKFLFFLSILAFISAFGHNSGSNKDSCLRFIANMEKSIDALSTDANREMLPFQIGFIVMTPEEAAAKWPDFKDEFLRLREKLTRVSQQSAFGNK